MKKHAEKTKRILALLLALVLVGTNVGADFTVSHAASADASQNWGVADEGSKDALSLSEESSDSLEADEDAETEEVLEEDTDAETEEVLEEDTDAETEEVLEKDTKNEDDQEDETTPEQDVSLLEVEEETHYIATYTGKIPEVEGVTWADSVTVETFAEDYSTVKIEDADGNEWQVEVVPEGLVYFIDCNDPGNNADTVPYKAVKALVGEQLLNTVNDQYKTDATTWGLTGTVSQKRASSLDVTDKTATGFYEGSENSAGLSFSYDLALESGKYTLTSAHREWWTEQNRKMDLSLTMDGNPTTYESVPALGNGESAVKEYSFEIKEAQTVTFTATSTGNQAPAISWLAVERTGDADPTEPTAPEQPTLPEGFSEPLEDNDKMTLATRTATSLVSGCETVIDVAVQWNNKEEYHASVTEAEELFKKEAFTVLFDVRQDAPSGDTSVTTQRTAMTIGNAANSIHILTYSGELGYGASPSGISSNRITLTGVEKNGWNAVAMTYEETDGGNGKVVVYVNGQKAGEVSDIGFKLSEMEDLTSMIARTFYTNYLQEGRYDNIVVGDSVLDETTAIAETAYRKYVKDNPGADTLLLESYIAQAEALITAGLTSAELESTLAAAKALMERELTRADQEEIDEAASALQTEIAKLNPTEILIIGEDVESAADNINGLTWKGFGMLNGNSTSNLLLDYKAENPDEYWDMMEYLFGGSNPLFTHIKMEMGNDGNNSTGAESCTMRYEDEEADASRSPGFVMAADAKKINPDVKISILRWGCPVWVNNYSGEAKYAAIYKWYKETVFDAYEKYGYVVDFINPDTNETGNPDEAIIKYFANALENETDFPAYFTEDAKTAYNNIRIIASDENKGLQIVPSMRADEEVYEAVDIIGFHYRTDATEDYVRMADVDDKEVWYSEGCATFGYTELQENKTTEYGYESIGGYQSPLALMDSFIVAFNSSRRTHYVFQPAIGSFYEGIQYGHKELLSARDPWSGYIHYDPALYMLQHFTNFAVTGWEDNDASQNEIWRVISSATEGGYAGSSSEHQTTGIDGDASYMTLAAPDKSEFSTVFVNNTRNSKTFLIKAEDLGVNEEQDLTIWTTVTDSYLQKTGTVSYTEGQGWYVTLPAYSVVTATTLEDEDVTVKRFPTEDNSGDYIQNEDRTVLDTDNAGRGTDTTDNVLYADNFNYAEEPAMKQYNAATKTETEVDYLTARGNEPRYMLDTHGAWIVENGKLKHELENAVTQWNGGEPSTIVGDFRWMDYAASIDVEIPDASADTWMRLGIRNQTGMNWNNSGYTLEINGAGSWNLYRIGTKVAGGSAAASEDGKYSLKLLALGDTIAAQINDEVVATYQDSAPMLSGRVKISSTWNQVYADNLLVETIEGGIPYATAMIDGQDDAVSYEGSWIITNPGGGSADNWYRTISTSNSENAKISFEIDGSGFAITGPNSAGVVLDVYVDNALAEEDAVTVASPTRGEAYILSDLTAGVHQIEVVVKSGSLVVDAIHTIGERITSDIDPVVSIETELPTLLAITTDGSLPESLPQQVTVKTMSGKEETKNVTWEMPQNLEDAAFDQVMINGTVEGAINSLGYTYMLSIPAEVVPAGTVYYIDTVTADMSVTTTESFAAVKALLGEKLLNNQSDQLKTDETTWGLVDQDAGTKGYTGTSDKTATGIYGKYNSAGETLTYALALPAGTYKLISAHREWWSMTRPMTAEITINGETVSTANLPLTGSSGDIINEAKFAVDEESVIYYTITATGSQAPVISWLAVAEEGNEELLEELRELIDQIEAAVEEAESNGVVYAETPLNPGEYTGAGEAPKDNLQDLKAVIAEGESLLEASQSAKSTDIIRVMEELNEVYHALREIPEEYTSIPGTDGDVIYASGTGTAMQAHGGSVMTMIEGTGEGCVNQDLDGDGQITEEKTVYLWYGENKTNDTRPVDGVRLYTSTDLYNWTDRGNVLYLQNAILPIEISEEKAVTSQTGASGVGTEQDYNTLQLSESNLETLKAWGKLSSAPEGVSEEDFGNVKLFLRAYVTKFEKEPTGLYDTTWIAKSYDETAMTATSLLYPDSYDESVRNVSTTPLQLAFETLYGNYCITERPKVIYNESTGKYVMVFHSDGPLYNNETLNEWVADGCEGTMSASRYSRAMVGFAESDTPYGPFKLVNVTRMNYDSELHATRLGEARDMTVFVDEGVDSNNDGADDAYVVYSSEMNAKLYVSLLNADYTAPIAEGDEVEWGVEAAKRILEDNSREAPAVFKYDGYYYLITSGTDGWNSTAHIYYRSTNMLSGWEKVGNPALNDTGKCFDTQVTYVIPVDAENGLFIYMGDRWNGNDLSDSRTVWLPIQMNSDHTLSVIGMHDWTLEDLYGMAPIDVHTELPNVVYADGSNLPEELSVTYQGETVNTAVDWTIENLGDTVVMATLKDCDNAQIRLSAFVAPKNLVYFVNPSQEPLSEDYEKILAENADTLLNQNADGAYSEEAGFGYVGAEGKIRGNNADIYQSLRYATSGNSIEYQFDLEEGNYRVYVGMFDPSSWWNGNRYADVLFNEEIVTEGYHYLNNENDTLFYDVTLAENGALNIEIAKSALSSNDVQLSFIMIEKVQTVVNPEEPANPENPKEDSSSSSSSDHKDDKGTELIEVAEVSKIEIQSQAPGTGDSSNAVMWVVILFIAAAATVILYTKKRKKA